MIDDTTLAEWERHVTRGFATSWLADAIAEIRRLREVHNQGVRRLREMEAERDAARTDRDLLCYVQKDLDADLAAHRAVVRELAEASEKYIAEVQANLRAVQLTVPGPPEPPRWAALQYLQSWLADPLVQQAREDK